jgi:hypothetical protein
MELPSRWVYSSQVVELQEAGVRDGHQHLLRHRDAAVLQHIANLCKLCVSSVLCWTRAMVRLLVVSQ